jgi:hypothetical protein
VNVTLPDGVKDVVTPPPTPFQSPMFYCSNGNLFDSELL